jgi:curved DNA-binding protein CbpA
MKDFYQILEVPNNAPQESIRQQYRFLILAWHPDRFANAAQKAQALEKAKVINLAYETLGDPGKRAQYDYERRLASQSARFEEQEQQRGGRAEAEKHQRADVGISERQSDYIQFFSELLADLRKTAPFSVRMARPDGLNYYKIARLPTHGTSVVEMAVVFTQSKQFMIEFFIDTAQKSQNKQIFDVLQARRGAIEAEFRERLTWERLNEKKGSRIAVYRDYYITDSGEKLSKLQDWAVEAMIRLYPIMDTHVSDVMKSLEA